MKSLRKINRTHKKRNTNKKTQRRYRRSKRVTQKGGILGFTGKERRAKCSYRQGNDLLNLDGVIHEVFHQLNKIKNWKGQKKTTYFGANPEKKVKLHKDRLDASLRQLDCGMLKTLLEICHYVKTKGQDKTYTGGEGPFAPPPSVVDPGYVDPGYVKREAKRINEVNKPLTEVPFPEKLPSYIIKRDDKSDVSTSIIETKPEEEKELPDDDDEPYDDQEENTDVVGLFKLIKDYLIELSSECSKEMFLDAENNVVQDKNKHIEDLILQFNEEHLNDIKKEICDKKDIESKKNLDILSAMRGNPNPINMRITRHGPSCNNIASATKLQKTMEPNLTDMGIERLMRYKLEDQESFANKFNSTHIFVSPLLRTWMTAIILYGFNRNMVNKGEANSKDITLLISPYLKEHFQAGLKTGNFPIDLQYQIDRIVKFLNDLYEICGDNDIYNQNELVKKITIQFPMMKNNKKGFGNIEITRNSNSNEYTVAKSSASDKKFDLYGLRNWSKSYFKSTSASLFGYFTKPNTESKESYENKYGYVFDGEIGDFIKWLYLHREALKPYLKQPTIHIVAHSNLMKSGMKSINKYLEDKGKKVHELTKKITDTNAWTLKIQDFNYENIIIHPGIPKKEKGDPKWDKNIQCNTK